MHTDRTALRRCKRPATWVAASLLLAATGFTAEARAETRAEGSAQPPSDIVRLEQAFWICDHAATTRGVDGDSAMLCFALTEELKNRKFAGDFDALLAWWREHKPAMHATLERREETLTRR